MVETYTGITPSMTARSRRLSTKSASTDNKKGPTGFSSIGLICLRSYDLLSLDDLQTRIAFVGFNYVFWMNKILLAVKLLPKKLMPKKRCPSCANSKVIDDSRYFCSLIYGRFLGQCVLDRSPPRRSRSWNRQRLSKHRKCSWPMPLHAV